MKNTIAQYEQLQQEQERIARALEALQEDEAFKNDMKCKKDIEEFLREYNKEPKDLLRLFPEIVPDESKAKPVRTRKSPKSKRPLIRYTHPETKETVDSKGLNHKTLQAWIAEYDRETVKSWGVPIDDETTPTVSPATLSKDENSAATDTE